jgi:hypothetical protein
VSFWKGRKEGTLKSGCGTNEMYMLTWFAFRSVRFVPDKFKTTDAQNTDTEVNAQSIFKHVSIPKLLDYPEKIKRSEHKM